MPLALQRLCALALCWMFAVSAWSAAQPIKGMRLWPAPDNTRLVLDLSAKPEYRVSHTDQRITIDLRHASLPRGVPSLKLGETPIQRVSTAKGPRAGDLRLVLELKRKVTLKHFALAPNQRYGHRLVLDLIYSEGPAMVAVERPEKPVPAPPVTAKPRPEKPQKSEPPVAPRPIAGNGRLRPVVIAVDAGHGGEDPGAIGPNKLQEKRVTLAIARELVGLINAERGFRAVLVRSGDYFIPLKQRRDIARGKGADFFVSVHADSAPSKSARGSSVYALSLKGATSVQARTLAQRENAADLVGGVQLSDKDDLLANVLVDLQMTGTLDASLRAGAMVLTELKKLGPLHSSKVEQAGFAVLKSVDMPSILVETGYISNAHESRLLGTDAHQKKLARAIFYGVRRYFYKAPPPGTLIAEQAVGGGSAARSGPRED